jgi:hypothetical protein
VLVGQSIHEDISVLEALGFDLQTSIVGVIDTFLESKFFFRVFEKGLTVASSMFYLDLDFQLKAVMWPGMALTSLFGTLLWEYKSSYSVDFAPESCFEAMNILRKLLFG